MSDLFSKARDLVERLSRTGFAAFIVTFAALVSGYVSAGQPVDAPAVKAAVVGAAMAAANAVLIVIQTVFPGIPNPLRNTIPDAET